VPRVYSHESALLTFEIEDGGEVHWRRPAGVNEVEAPLREPHDYMCRTKPKVDFSRPILYVDAVETQGKLSPFRLCFRNAFHPGARRKHRKHTSEAPRGLEWFWCGVLG